MEDYLDSMNRHYFLKTAALIGTLFSLENRNFFTGHLIRWRLQ